MSVQHFLANIFKNRFGVTFVYFLLMLIESRAYIQHALQVIYYGIDLYGLSIVTKTKYLYKQITV